MASLDVESLFTNIPLEETIDICVENLYNDNQNLANIPKHDFCNLLNIATKETFFMFKNKYYKQVDGVAKRIHNCPNDFKPVFYRCYVDDIFVLFSSPDYADKFREYVSPKHPNIKFSIEKEKDRHLPFLDINIFGENDKFGTNVYRKKTFSRVYTNFKSFKPETYKIGLIKSLLLQCFSLCSDFIKFHHDIKHHFKVRMCEHLGISALTGKRVKGDDDSAIKFALTSIEKRFQTVFYRRYIDLQWSLYQLQNKVCSYIM